MTDRREADRPGRWVGRGLRARIWLPYALLLLVALPFSLWVVGATGTRLIERSLTRQFETTGNLFRALLDERARRLLGETSLLASDFALKRSIATYDPETLASVAENQRARLGVAFLWIADERGTLLAVAGGDMPRGSSVATMQPVDRAIDGVAAEVAIAEVGGGLAQVVATPVFAPDPIGYIVAGEPIDDRTADQLQATAGTIVSFLGPGRVYGSSWPPGARSTTLSPSPVRSDPSAGETYLVRVDGRRYLSRSIPISSDPARPLSALVQASYDDALGPLAALPKWVALVGGVALAAALAVGAWIASGIAAPLQILARAMRRVLDGDLTQRVNLDRGDEVGFLARAFNEMVAGLAERERIEATFGRFVSRDVAAAVLSGDLPLGGERREVTVLFQDVRGYTTIAEQLEPDTLVRVVNRLFTEMVAAVEKEGGVVRQFTGDGVMAMFGAPVAHTDDPERAVRAALDMVARLPALNRRLREDGLPPLAVGIGVHTGDVVAGRIGPDERSEYSVVGDAVNVAARIEALTREVDVPILASAATASRLGSAIRQGRRWVLPVKGKAQLVEVVEIVASAAGAAGVAPGSASAGVQG